MNTALPPMTERDWQRQVVDAAHALGWRTYHTWLSARSQPGFPDLVLCRERVIWVEVKAEKGRLSDAQREWLAALKAAGQEVYLWRPSQWAEVEDVLRRREVASP